METTSSASGPHVIDGDLACVRCGYNLRGLPAGGECPECGTSLEASTRGPALALAGRWWLRRMGACAALLVVHPTAFVVAFVAATGTDLIGRERTDSVVIGALLAGLASLPVAALAACASGPKPLQGQAHTVLAWLARAAIMLTCLPVIVLFFSRASARAVEGLLRGGFGPAACALLGCAAAAGHFLLGRLLASLFRDAGCRRVSDDYRFGGNILGLGFIAMVPFLLVADLLAGGLGFGAVLCGMGAAYLTLCVGHLLWFLTSVSAINEIRLALGSAR